ncbi:MAG TPA: potassium/proton antiporter [Thermoleophilaceae bacterium]
MSEGTLIFVAGALLALGIAASLVAGRLRVPGLVLFLALGMAIGSDGLGWLDFGHTDADKELARTIGVIALGLILFEGGLAAGWEEIRPVVWPSATLAVAGTILTAVVVGLAGAWLLDLETVHGLLLGSIVAATDGAAVFSILRGSSIKRRVARVLEAESGMNDPIAVVLVLGFIDTITEPDFGALDMIGRGVLELSIGAASGILVGLGAAEAFRRVRFGTTGLYPVGSIAAAALSFGLADVLHGSGFIAAYLTGLILGSAQIPARRTIADFHDGLAWVSQIAVFFTLGLLVFPSQFGDVAADSLLIAAVLILVARPLSTLVCTLPFGFSLREATLVNWGGLRGAAPIVLATFPLIETKYAPAGEAQDFFNIVFFVVLASTILQGATFERLAVALGLTTKEPAIQRPLVEVGTIRRLGAEVLEFPVGDSDAIAGRLVNELGLPRDALVSVIVRGDQALLPRGSTTIEGGDRLHILVRQPVREQVEGLFERWRAGPIGEPEEVILPMHGRASIFSVRPWKEEFGDAGDPREVEGIEVVRHLRVRRGQPGALVQLQDGRYAVTGDGLVAIGGPRRLFRYCRDRIRAAEDPVSVAWWQEVAGVLSQHVAR